MHFLGPLRDFIHNLDPLYQKTHIDWLKIVKFNTSMKTRKYSKRDNGFPYKKDIRHLVDKYNLALSRYDMEVNPKCVTFNESYSEKGKRAGILWKDTSQMMAMDGFHTYLMEHGIKIKAVKYWGQVHSIWFACDNAEK